MRSAIQPGKRSAALLMVLSIAVAVLVGLWVLGQSSGLSPSVNSSGEDSRPDSSRNEAVTTPRAHRENEGQDNRLTSSAQADQRVAESANVVVTLVCTVHGLEDALSSSDKSVAQYFTESGQRRLAPLRDGSFTFTGLRPGVGTLLFSARGFRSVSRRISLRSDEAVHREDIMLEGVWVFTVHLRTPEGGSAYHMLADALESPNVVLLLAVTSEALSGRFPRTYMLDDTSANDASKNGREPLRLASNDDTQIDTVLAPPAYVNLLLGNQVLVSQRIEDRLTDVTLTISPEACKLARAGLVISVTDAYGPVAGAEGVLFNNQHPEGQRTVSDAMGNARFSNQAPGLYQIEIRSATYPTVCENIELLAGEVRTLPLTLKSGLTISGTIVPPSDNTTVAYEAYIWHDDAESAVIGIVPKLHALSVAQDGRFATNELASGRYVIVATGYKSAAKDAGYPIGISAPALVDSSRGIATNLYIQLVHPTQVVLVPSSLLVDRCEVVVRTDTKLLYRGGMFGQLMGQRMYFAPGSYHVVVSGNAELLGSKRFEVTSEPQVVEVP